MKLVKTWATVLLFCTVALLFGCLREQVDYIREQIDYSQDQADYYREQADTLNVSNFTARMRHTTEAFGTISTLRLYDDFSLPENVARFERIWQESLEILLELDSIFSSSLETSEVSRFNALVYGESMAVSSHMAHVIKLSRLAYADLGGRFDPTVFPLTDLWGFSPRFRTNHFIPRYPYDRAEGRGQLPDPKYVAAFLQLVDLNNILLSGCEMTGFTLTKGIAPVTVNGHTYQAQLDFGAILKGYATDLVHEILLREGLAFGYFSSGGSSMAFLRGLDAIGESDGAYLFALNLRKPRPGNEHGSSFITILVGETSLSTSGDYDHAFFLDGIRYSHIFDPRTGHPVNPPREDGIQRGIAAATVLGSGAAHVETLSTALLIMSLDEAIAFINEHSQEYQVVLVYYNSGYDFFEVITNLPAERFTILDTAYVLASRLDGDGKVEYVGHLAR